MVCVQLAHLLDQFLHFFLVKRAVVEPAVEILHIEVVQYSQEFAPVLAVGVGVVVTTFQGHVNFLHGLRSLDQDNFPGHLGIAGKCELECADIAVNQRVMAIKPLVCHFQADLPPYLVKPH